MTDPGSSSPPAESGPTPPRRGFRLQGFGWAILAVAVFLALFRDHLRRDPWGLARYFISYFLPLMGVRLTASPARSLSQAASARPLAWGAGRQDWAGRLAAWIGVLLKW